MFADCERSYLKCISGYQYCNSEYFSRGHDNTKTGTTCLSLGCTRGKGVLLSVSKNIPSVQVNLGVISEAIRLDIASCRCSFDDLGSVLIVLYI